MAKVKFRKIREAEKIISNRLTKLARERRTLDDVADFTIKRIQQQTRLGKSMVTGKKLKGLSDSYIDVRYGSIKFRTINGKRVPFLEPDEKLKNVDPEFFEPEFSNLTFTGQLLRSLKAKIDQAAGVVTVAPTGQRDDGLSNQEVAEFVRKAGRPFLGLDDKATDQIKKIVLDNLRRILRGR